MVTSMKTAVIAVLALLLLAGAAMVIVVRYLTLD